MVRPEKFVGDLHEALSKFADHSQKLAAAPIVNTNALTSTTNRPAPSAN
jgi:hypothetical protein